MVNVGFFSPWEAAAVSLAMLICNACSSSPGSDRAASHGSPRQVYGNERDGPAGAEYVRHSAGNTAAKNTEKHKTTMVHPGTDNDNTAFSQNLHCYLTLAAL